MAGGAGGGAPRVLAIVGPTACGKSAVALGVAEALRGEVVIADPFQRYRGLEIAADSPSGADRARVAHHGVGDLDLTQRSDAAGFAALAHAAIDAAVAADRVPVVSGGTGLYVRAALAQLDFPPEPPAEVRAGAEADADDDARAAAAEVARLDPARAAGLDPANPRRVARALALARAGTPARSGSALWTADTRHPTLIVALTRPREELDRRIAKRVRRELADGLVAEIETALDTPDLAREPAQIIGMREVAALREGALEATDLPAALATRTRRLARKQLTWLRKTPGLVELDMGEAEAAEAIPRVLDLWRAAQAT